jgi:large subunit ribosomal protein L35
MPKHKTSKTAAKRFKVTGSGKIVHKRAGGAHLLSGKSRGRKRRLRRKSVLTRGERMRVAPMLRH